MCSGLGRAMPPMSRPARRRIAGCASLEGSKWDFHMAIPLFVIILISNMGFLVVHRQCQRPVRQGCCLTGGCKLRVLMQKPVLVYTVGGQNFHCFDDKPTQLPNGQWVDLLGLLNSPGDHRLCTAGASSCGWLFRAALWLCDPAAGRMDTKQWPWWCHGIIQPRWLTPCWSLGDIGELTVSCANSCEMLRCRWPNQLRFACLILGFSVTK